MLSCVVNYRLRPRHAASSPLLCVLCVLCVKKNPFPHIRPARHFCLTPLESALTQCDAVTPLESALTQNCRVAYPHLQHSSAFPYALTPLFATHPRNPRLTSFLATHPKPHSCKSFVCHTSETPPGAPRPILEFRVSSFEFRNFCSSAEFPVSIFEFRGFRGSSRVFNFDFRVSGLSVTRPPVYAILSPRLGWCK